MRIRVILLAISLAFQNSPVLAQNAAPAPEPSGRSAVVTYYLNERRAPVSIELFRGIALFKVKIAGRDAWMMLDNGAEHSLIDAALLEPLGIKSQENKGRMMRTPTGIVLPYRIALEVPLVIPGQLEGRIPMAAVDLKSFSSMAGHPIDAVLGADLLNASILSLDVGGRVLQLLPRSAKVGAAVAPITLTKGKAQFEASIGGQPVQLTIDLGFVGELSLSPEAWARVGPPDAKREARSVGHIDGNALSVDHASLPAISIGSIERKNIDADIRPIPVRDGDGWIGMGLMSQFIVMMDVTGGNLWLAPRLPAEPASPSASTKPAQGVGASKP
jgi:hypothetical protein